MNERTKAIIEAERAFGLEVKIDLWVLTIHGRNDDYIYVYKTETEVNKHLYDIVADNWEYGDYDDDCDKYEFPLPDDKEEAIERFFEENDDQSYNYEAFTLVYTASELVDMETD